jgi:hypothetical protein
VPLKHALLLGICSIAQWHALLAVPLCYWTCSVAQHPRESHATRAVGNTFKTLLLMASTLRLLSQPQSSGHIARQARDMETLFSLDAVEERNKGFQSNELASLDSSEARIE